MTRMTVEAYYRKHWPAVLELADDPEEIIQGDTARLLELTRDTPRTGQPVTFPKQLLDRTCGTVRDF